jgi:serine/threonine-protein kinase
VAKQIGRYTVVRELKGGGMGSVTLCRAPDGGLVVLKRPYATDEEAVIRLRDEARIGSRLMHPGIVDTLDLFEHDGAPVLVVAFVDGPSLEELRRIGPLPTIAVARIGRQIADALDALHSATDERDRPLHILHRDVTPGNIVVSREGDARLIDLGIARFSERQAERTQDGFLRGTMRYLAPELLEGETYSPASDLWSLGMVLWEAALGRFAYAAESDREVLAGIVLGKPMKLKEGENVDLALVAAIEPLLQRSAAARTVNAAEAAARFADLEERLGDSGPETAEAIEQLLEWKEATDPSVAELDEKIRALGTGFTDEETFAEPLSEEVKRAAFEPKPTVPLQGQPNERGPRVHLGDPDVADPAMHTVPVEPAPGIPADEALQPKATVAIPAPIRFSTLSGQGAVAKDVAADKHPAVGDDDDDDDSTFVDLPKLVIDSDDETEQRVREVHEALAELDADEPALDPHPPVSDDAQATISVSSPPLPRDALRSDHQDVEERAAGFEEGVSVEAPSAPVATSAPAMQMDDDDIEEMHTLDGLSPVRFDDPPEVTLRTPPPAPRTDLPSADTGATPDRPHRAAHRHSPSWDAVEAVKAGAERRSHAHFAQKVAGDAVSVGDDADGKAVARVGLVRKTREQLTQDRRGRAAPTPGERQQKIDIDALPAARPRPREERPTVDGPSPFSDATEVLEPSPSLLEDARPDASIDVPDLQVRDRSEVETQKVRKLPDDEPAEDGDVDDDEGEPTAVDLQPIVSEAEPELRMDTQVGAKIQDLPPPAAPIEPLGPFVQTEALGSANEPNLVSDDEDASTDKKPREFKGGEIVSLGEMASLLDDD